MQTRHSLFCLGGLLLGALAVCGDASAGSYRAWYVDQDDGFYQYGDLTTGGSVVEIPPSACARRFELPSYYRWADEYGGTITAADLYSTVEIWVPKPGCPNGGQLVFQTKNGQVFEPPAGAHYLELYSNYGSNWVGADGQHLSCLPDCVGLGGWGYSIERNDWGVLILAMDELMQTLPGNDRTRTGHLLAEVVQRMPALQDLAGRTVAERRRTPLAGFEASTRALEDAALAQTQTAARRLLDCRGAIAAGAGDRAHAGCDRARDALMRAADLLRVAEDAWR